MTVKARRIAASLVALSVLSAVGCEKNTDAEDVQKIQAIPPVIIEALANDDPQQLEAVSGYDYTAREDYEFSMAVRGEDLCSMIRHTYEFAQVADMGEVVFDREDNTAEMAVTFSFLDIDRMISDLPSTYLTYDGWIAAMDECDERAEKTFRLDFYYDEEGETWYLTEEDAQKVADFLEDRANILPIPVSISEEDARAVFDACIEDLVQDGCSDYYEPDADAIRRYDPITVRGEGSLTEDAIDNFVSAYMSYVMDHDPEIVEDQPYHYIITGQAPSHDQLSDVLYTDEFRVEYFMNYLRRGDWSTSLISDLLWDEQSSFIYNSLADEIPSCDGEEYVLTAEIDPYSEDPMLIITSDLIIEPARTIYEAEHSMGWEETRDTIEQALDNLLEAGQIDEYEYAAWIRGLTPENYGFVDSDIVSSSGHPNQAVGSFEQVPEWCEDGSIVYGYSNPDSNGVWMFYSKDPDTLDTAGYFIGDGGVWITNYFITEFGAGTTLIVDWWIDDELVVDTEIVYVDEDGTQEIEVFLPEHPSSGQEVEMRLWDQSHRHVYSYVILYF